MIVPSLVPTIEKSKKINDNTTARITQITSKAILTLPNSLWIVSDIAFTKASPELRITFAVTEREIPKSVNKPNRNDSGTCRSCIN